MTATESQLTSCAAVLARYRGELIGTESCVTLHAAFYLTLAMTMFRSCSQAENLQLAGNNGSRTGERRLPISRPATAGDSTDPTTRAPAPLALEETVERVLDALCGAA